MKIIEAVIKNDIYVFTGGFSPGKKALVDSFEDISITKNGKEMSSFGSTWAGSKLTSYDYFGAILAAYFNDDEIAKFSYACEQVIAYKNKKQIYSPAYRVGARSIPGMIITPSGDLHKLVAITKDAEGNANATYVCYDEKYDSFDGDSMVMTRMDGSVATDIPAFATSALVQAAEDGEEFVYVEPMTKDWINKELEENDCARKLA